MLSDRHLAVMRFLVQNPDSTIAAIERGVGFGSLTYRYVHELQGRQIVTWQQPEFCHSKLWKLSDRGKDYLESLTDG